MDTFPESDTGSDTDGDSFDVIIAAYKKNSESGGEEKTGPPLSEPEVNLDDSEYFATIGKQLHADLDALLAIHQHDRATLDKIQALVAGIPANIVRWKQQHDLAASRRIEREMEREKVVRAFLAGPTKYYYVPASDTYIRYVPSHQGQEPHSPFEQVSADDAIYHALSTTPKTVDGSSKGKILAAIMRRIHACSLTEFTPDQIIFTLVHSTVDAMFPPGPVGRLKAKHFLTAVGDIIQARIGPRSKHRLPTYHVSEEAADFVAQLHGYAMRFFRANLGKTITATRGASSTYLDIGSLPPLSDPSTVPAGTAFQGRTSNHMLSILCVAHYYSRLHGSAPAYLENMADMHPEMRETVLEITGSTSNSRRI